MEIERRRLRELEREVDAKERENERNLMKTDVERENLRNLNMLVDIQD